MPTTLSKGTVQAVKAMVSEFFTWHTVGWRVTSAQRDVLVDRLFGEMILPVLHHEPSSAKMLIAVGRMVQVMQVSVKTNGEQWLEGRSRALLGR